MLKVLLFIIIIWAFIPIFKRFIRPWLTRYLMRKAQRYTARRFGFDPDAFAAFSEGAGNTASEKNREEYAQQYRTDQSRKTQRPTGSSGPIIPKEYAEDVEFTEIRTYSSETVIGPEGVSSEERSTKKSFFRRGKERIESQVSDAEIIEIRR